MQLSDLKVGHAARIVALLQGERSYRQRLVAMGLVPGTRIVLLHIAPLGDPVEIRVRGSALCLRKAEASLLLLAEAQ